VVMAHHSRALEDRAGGPLGCSSSSSLVPALQHTTCTVSPSLARCSEEQENPQDTVTDELENEVITTETDTEKLATESNKRRIISCGLDIIIPTKRKLIGDEFYREPDEKIVNNSTEVISKVEDIDLDEEEIPCNTEQVLYLSVSDLGVQFSQNDISGQLTPPNSSSPVNQCSPQSIGSEAHYHHSPFLTPLPDDSLASIVVSAKGEAEETNIFPEHLSCPELPQGDPMVVSYNGSSGVDNSSVVVSEYLTDHPDPVNISCQMMTATPESVLDSVLVNSLTSAVKHEPEDLTGGPGGRSRHGSDHHHTANLLQGLDVGVGGQVKRMLGESLDKQNMGLVTTPDGDSHIILNSEDLPLAPGFTSTAISSSGYDPPSFYSTSSDQPYRETGTYRDQDYPGEGGFNGNRGGQNGSYSLYPSNTQGLSVDLPSPDSGIGPDQITPRGIVDNDTSYGEYSTQQILDNNTIRKPWHDYGSRNSETEKIQIPKVYSPYGFHYILDAPTSSSVRREDDKVTYINKGQFYGVTLDYQPDPEHAHLKSPTVKSVIMLVFRRDGKSQEEEIKAWQFWHQRQHSVKQRIIDVDTKNSLGLVGCIEELSHNALAVYWNPLDSPAKVNLAVQCLSTDFSTQKGVKGLPLHVQIDTYDDPRSEVGSPSTHRGYCQVKIFCDKGAERKLRDEERRANKRRMTPSGKRRLDEMYHESFDRTEFYSMSDLNKPPTLFSPPEDPEKSSQLNADFPGFYSPQRQIEAMKPMTNGDLLPGLMSGVGTTNHVVEPLRRGPEKTELQFLEKSRRHRLIPPVNERIMVYVRQETEDVYTPLHLVPPTVSGLINSIENKYKINASNIRYLYRKNKDGIIAKIDDDMLRLYCNEDVFLMQVMVTEGPGGEETMVYDITLSEIQSSMEH